MPRELITVQVGQCGNQVGLRFWELALREHQGNRGLYDDALSSFFRNVDVRDQHPLEVGTPISSLKARTVVVDMEEGVIAGLLRSEYGEIFDTRQIISDVSGAGNNWAVGFHEYGQKYKEDISEKVRRTTEYCDSLQSFFMMHSMGGGTGSGLGSFICSLLEDDYPEIFRFSTVVYPEDEVITGPYNALLATHHLSLHSDCVLPIHNKALFDILNLVDSAKGKGQTKTDDGKGAYDRMNSLIAHLLNDLTCSMRFPGTLNVDLNEITMNLVPFPMMQFLQPAMSPLFSVLDVKAESRSLNQAFSDVMTPDFQLLKTNPRQGTYLACGLIVRGAATISDMERNIRRLRREMNMIHWNREGFKIGLCAQAPVGMKYSLLCLANNTSIKTHFMELKSKVMRFFKRGAHVHHYTKVMGPGHFEEALQHLDTLVANYTELENASPAPARGRITPVL